MSETKDLQTLIEESISLVAEKADQAADYIREKTSYELAKQRYATIGVDTDAAIEKLKNVTVS
ncbi:MAG: L-rhamnose isomerase, partial [Lachnospiraceae bacterium]|nr:L-rhamnose isomerase [Lachnospiraceae bacterium]